MKAKLGSEAGMQCKPNEFLLQLECRGGGITLLMFFTLEYKEMLNTRDA